MYVVVGWVPETGNGRRICMSDVQLSAESRPWICRMELLACLLASTSGSWGFQGLSDLDLFSSTYDERLDDIR